MNRTESLFNSIANTIWGLFAKRPPEDLLRNVKIVAHRGVHEGSRAKENSREAFQFAVENRLWGIEFDIRWTKDDVPVIHHDENCSRIYNSLRVISHSTFAELRQEVPDLMSLEEAVLSFSQKIVFMIELKDSLKGFTAREEKLAKILGRLIPRKHFYLLALDAQILESVHFVSKKAMMIVALRSLAPAIKQALVFGHGGVSGPFVFLSNDALKTCKENGVLTGTGFIESRGAFYREVGRGVDMIFTNTPLALKSFL